MIVQILSKIIAGSRSSHQSRRATAGAFLCLAALGGGAGSAGADVVINELMARNRGAHTNATGDDRADWIELHNNGALPVDLTGWHLSDDPFDLMKWTFPATTIQAGGYLLIYADKSAEPVISGELHANFALDTDGEALMLVAADGVTEVDSITSYEYNPGQFGFPPQEENISYGRNAGGGFSYFDPSSPGAVNAGGAGDLVADTRFSHDRGFYTSPFELVISTHTPDAQIYYTLDGSEPDTSSTLYTGPIPISETSCVRARGYKSGLFRTNIDTHTYIFVADVVNQSPTGNTPPTPEWPSFDINGQVMQYGMDPDITQHPDYADLVDDALLAIPTLSLVTDLDNLFGVSNGIYVNASQEGDPWERVTSVELIHPDGSEGFQENAGLRIRGGASRQAAVPKHGFRLRFRREYGAAKLDYPIFGDDGPDRSNGVDLRCSQTPGWHYFDGRSVFARDIFARDLQIAQGQPSTRGDKYHLYLNGVYWGMYETQENLEPSFLAENYGGEDEDYDIISKKKHGYKVDGSDAAYRDLFDLTMAGFSGAAGMDRYYQAQGYESDGVTRNPSFTRLLDVQALVDYMLVHYWTGELDGMAGRWGLNNYICAFNRENPDGFKFFKYDSEWSLDVGFTNNVTRTDTSTDFNRFNGLVMHGKLVQNPEYLIAFADQAHKHFFNDGVMTPARALEIFTRRTDEIDLAIIGESARWGDAKYPSAPKTKNGDWVPDVNTTRNWISGRTSTVISQLRNAGWYPSLDAPVFSQHGGTFSGAFQLSMTGPGTIVYTLDGTDPRQILTGASQGTVYSGPVPLTHAVVVKARSMTSDTNWSALNEAVFVPDVPNTLRISEVMYNPRQPAGEEADNGKVAKDFEFIEIHNTGATEIGLAGVELLGRLGSGVSFDFSAGNVTSVPPMGHVIVVSDLVAFAQRYSTDGLLIAGEYSGNLDNGGDRIELVSPLGEVLAKFDYGDGRDWPISADGAGHSLVPLVTADQAGGAMEYGANWRASAYLDGSPGAADPAPVATVVLNEIEAHTDYSNPTPPFDQYDSNDGIELYNTTAGSISLGGWYLSDDADDLKKWPIPATTTIAGDAWHWFTEVDDFHNPITSGFGIDKGGETIFLSYLPGTSADRVVDAVEFEGQANAATWARLPDGSGYWGTAARTPGAANDAAPRELVINEVMYHPGGDDPDHEYVEICNVSGETISLFEGGLTWRLSGGIDFAFPTGTTIAAGQCLAVVSFDPDDPLQADEKQAFLSAYRQYDGETQLFGPFSGKLSNTSDRITLEQPQEPDGTGDPPSWITADELTYFESAPWPDGADGTGMPLQRGDMAASGNDPAAWYVAGFASPGLPDTAIDLLTPLSGATLEIPVLAELTVAIDPERITGPVSQVEFFLDGSSLSVDTTAPYSYQLTLDDIGMPGSHVLQVVVQDSSGSHSSRSIPVGAEFGTRITITSPSDGQGLIPPYSTEITAAVDNYRVIGSVSQVEFFIDGISIGVDTSAPYTHTLDQPTAPGAYVLTAVMSDDLGSSSSPAISLNVFDSAPIVDLSAVPDHTILHGTGTQLDAVVDLNGLPPELVSVDWVKLSGPGAVNFATPHDPSTAATFSVAGVYEVQLIIHYGTHRISETRTVTVQDGNAPSPLRYEESFENYIDGTGLLGFNGWFDSTTPPVVSEKSYGLAAGVDQPIPYATHTKVLEVDDVVTKRFADTAAYSSLWIDSVVEMTHWKNPEPPEDRESAQLQIYVGDDGRLRVWCTPDPVGAPNTKGWATVPNLSIADGDFHRLTVHADYTAGPTGHFYFEVYIDGVQVTQPVSRFASANSDNAYLTQLVMSGPFALDDLVVDERDPFAALYLIQASAGANGSISPSTNIFLESGGSQSYSITPDQFFHIADVLVDQVSVGPVSTYEFSSVEADHVIEAVFAPDLAANATPHWWLYEQNPDWANDFDAAALGDSDNDLLFTWEEYLADTDPQDATSRQWLDIDLRSPTALDLLLPASAQRRYRIERQVALDGTWIEVDSMIGSPGADGIMRVEQPVPSDPRSFYRVRVELP